MDEKLTGIVSRITYHNPANGWSVLRLQPLDNPAQQETVTVHQTRVFAGATMSFEGSWVTDRKYGRQFKATKAVEKKPATTAAIEKYLGSGLIKGVGPKTAKRIVRHFGGDTLNVFENEIKQLTKVPGIASKKLVMIEKAWVEHRAIRDVMMFLQGHGISTLFAVRIFKSYGEQAINIVSSDPYRLSNDIYGIGFFSADNIALSLGFALDSTQRIMAAIKHVLAASREHGHCFLTQQQIREGVMELIELDLADRLSNDLAVMRDDDQLRVRNLVIDNTSCACFYSKSLFYDEASVAEHLDRLSGGLEVDRDRVARWLGQYTQRHELKLSGEQSAAVQGVVTQGFSVLTGGPGCGKTTTTLVIVRLLEAMGRRVLLSAPTGRATQRMAEVIGREAKTIHRMLVWQSGTFKHNEENPLDADFLIVDECSMLDISLSASLLKAVPPGCQVLFIGDADQLPSVGAGNVLKDIISSGVIPCFRLLTVFRQARESQIIQYAHQINEGRVPYVDSPFKTPTHWQDGTDCLFLDSDEATQEQIGFISRVKRYFDWKQAELEQLSERSPYEFRTDQVITSAYEQDFTVPEKFAHVDLESLHKTDRDVDALKSVLEEVHPWSSLHYALSCVDTVVNLYLKWIPKYQGKDTEIQILTPMTKGSLGTISLNKVIQEKANPPNPTKCQLSIGDRIFREGDRVIHRKNNYELNVFNGDIGKINRIDTENLTCEISFYPDGRLVDYKKEDITELDLAYAITIHKSQGSEFKTVIIPVLTQHFKMLYRNLIYTGLTRARSLAVFVGTRKALAMAVRQQDTSLRQTALEVLLKR
ncbi:recombinase RecD [Chromatiales bacterium (ex Bugula neritina AB1)]|nr:recombinase RecD [Chromatiales bacterium (ex Bugula neritina AB1)]